MGDHFPSNGGELQRDMLLAAVLARRIDGYPIRLADLALTRDTAGRVRVVADALAPEVMQRIMTEAADGGVDVVFHTREDLLDGVAHGAGPVAAVHLHAPESTPSGLLLMVSVSGFRSGRVLPLESLSFTFVPDGDGWRLVGEPLHIAS